MTVEEIKAAIPQFTLKERVETVSCLHGWEDDEWDAQLKRDLVGGKLDKLVKKVDLGTRFLRPEGPTDISQPRSGW